MKIYTLLEEWINERDAATEMGNAPVVTAYKSEEQAMEEWEQRKQWRNERPGCEVSQATGKTDANESGYKVRYYHFRTQAGSRAIIKTTIQEQRIY